MTNEPLLSGQPPFSATCWYPKVGRLREVKLYFLFVCANYGSNNTFLLSFVTIVPANTATGF